MKIALELNMNETSEAALRSIFDSNMVGIVFWNSTGEITDANDAFLQMVRYTREDLSAGRLRWKELTPPEYAPQDAVAIAQVNDRGACQPYEKEYFRKDGSRLHVLIGGARVAQTPLTGVAYVVDMSAKRDTDELN